VIDLDGTNPGLQPQTAISYNLGFTVQPRFAPGLKLDLAYYSIDFKSEISRLILENFFTNVLTDAAQLGSLVERNPSLSQIEQAVSGRELLNYQADGCTEGTPACPAVNLSTVGAIANIGYVNAATLEVRGIDLSIHHSGVQTPIGTFSSDIQATYLLRYDQNITEGAQPASLLNTPFNPLRLRAKATVAWRLNEWSANARLNYTNSYENNIDPYCTSTGTCKISSWTTVDLGLSYQTSNRTDLLKNVRVALLANNVFNRPPPLVSGQIYENYFFNFNYDTVNANPFQRTLGITFLKKWGDSSK
jgi:iron complex outermembrane receptor protein